MQRPKTPLHHIVSEFGQRKAVHLTNASGIERGLTIVEGFVTWGVPNAVIFCRKKTKKERVDGKYSVDQRVQRL